jgi:hypothetical protein
VEARRCPGAEVGLTITKNIFSAIVGRPNLQIKFASDFKHERTFPYGLPALVGYGDSHPSFRMKGKAKKTIKRWLIERKRMIEQGEIW